MFGSQLWSPGGLIVLHDTSSFAAKLDPTKMGGVQSALAEWLTRNKVASLSLNASVAQRMKATAMTYGDPCGLGIVQKSFL